MTRERRALLRAWLLTVLLIIAVALLLWFMPRD